MENNLKLFNIYQSATCKHLKPIILANSFEYHLEIYQKILEYSNTVTGVFPTIFKQCTIDFDCNKYNLKKKTPIYTVNWIYSCINRITKLKFNKKSVEL